MSKRKPTVLLLSLFLFVWVNAQVSKTVHVATPGTLSILLTQAELNTITDLTLTGYIDARDFKTMRINIPALVNLNIENVHIVSSEGLQGAEISLGSENAIPAGAFYDKRNLKTILLPKTATSIDRIAFYNTGLTNINIHKSFKKIGTYAFNKCTKLNTLFIDDATLEIQDYAFYQCELLSDVHLGNNVISFGDNAFGLCTSLTSFTVPISVKMLGGSVFWGCSGLKEIDIHAQINTLPESIFRYCNNLTDIKMPNTVEVIDRLAFDNCTSLTSIRIPNSVKIIKNAFVNCEAIIELNIPNSVNTIGDGAFGGCISLKKISLPHSITQLGSYTFSNCSALDTIIVNSYKPYITLKRYAHNESKIFESIDKSKCVLHVPYKAKKFYQAANDWKDFNNIIEKEYGVIPDTLNLNILPIEVANGEVNLFSNSTWAVRSDSPWLIVSPLTGSNNGKVSFVASANDSIGTRIANIIVTDNAGIEQKIQINQNGKLIKIELSAGELSKHFTKSEKLILTNLKLAGTMNSRDFKIIRDSLPVLNSLDLSDVQILNYQGNDGTSLNYSYNYAANEIPEHAFYTNIGGVGKSSLRFLKLPLKLDSIGVGAFYKCTGLTDIYIPKSVKSIKELAFADCLGLKNITVNNNKISFSSKIQIGYGIFRNVDFANCKLIVPYNTKQFYSNANQWQEFKNIEEYPYYLNLNSNIVDIKNDSSMNLAVQSNVVWKVSTDSIWLKFKSVTGMNNDSLSLFALPNPYFKPRSTIFKITSEELDPEYITVYQDGKSFSKDINAGKLKNSIPNELKNQITNIKLSGTMYARDFFFLRDSMPQLEKIDLKDIRILSSTDTILVDNWFYEYKKYNAKEIPGYAFFNKNRWIDNNALKSIILPDTVVSIGERAFYRCTALETINIGNFTEIIKYDAFGNCKSFTSIIIPESVTKLESFLLSGCDKLENCVIQSNIKEIPFGMFKDCIKLSSFTIPESVNSINSEAFFNCTSLTEIVIPQNVISIGNQVFQSCTSLTKLIVPKNVKSIGEYLLLKCRSLVECKIEGDISKLPTGTFNGCSSLKSFDISRSIKEIDHSAFQGCSGLDSIRVYSQIPATLVYNVFYSAPVSTCKLIVPKGSKVLYQNAMVWKDFTNIIEGLDTPNNLSITTPTIITNKMVDGNTTAVITQIGTLQGVDAADIGNVNVSAIASYDNANVGINKTITVVYTLKGSAKDKYVEPENYVITNAKISGFVTLNNLTKPAPACEGDALDVNYVIKTGTPTHYKITFNTEALNAGLSNISYTELPTVDNSGVLVIPVAANTKDGTYSGILKMKNELNSESPDYPFSFTINVSDELIKTKFDDIIMYNNADKRFVAFQWLMNGIEIPGATKQFYQSPIGLIGMYSVKLTTNDGEIVYTCPKVLSFFSSKAYVRANPNPIKLNEVCKIELIGFTDEQLKNANLTVFNTHGVCIYQTNAVQNLTELQLPTSGIYIGRVSGINDDYVFKIMVTK